MTACGTSGVESLPDASAADANTTDANGGAPDASAADANIADTSLPDAAVVPRITIAPGYDHTCAILDDNSVKCWGSNASGELGLGDRNQRGNNANEMGDKLPKVDLGTGRTAKALLARSADTCAILDDNSVKCWGSNYQGQLGLGDTNDRGDEANEMGDKLPKVDLGTK